MRSKLPYRPNESEWQEQPTLYMPISPSYTQPNMQQLPPLQNGQTPPKGLKRNPIFWGFSAGIACIILALIGYVLLSSLNFSPSSTTVLPRYPSLHTTYKGTITAPPLTSGAATPAPMALVITSNDHQGHISGRLAILVSVGDGDPFTGTLRTNGTITFTATPILIGVRTVFTGFVNHDGSISGTTENYVYQSDSWKLYPV